MEKIKEEYINFLSEIIETGSVIFGSGITIARAKNINGLILDESGRVRDLKRSEQQILQELSDSFEELGGVIFKNKILTLLKKYPLIKEIK